MRYRATHLRVADDALLLESMGMVGGSSETMGWIQLLQELQRRPKRKNQRSDGPSVWPLRRGPRLRPLPWSARRSPTGLRCSRPGYECQRWCPEYVILDRRVTAIEEDKFERLDDDLLEPPEDHDYRPVVLNQVLSLNIKKALLIMQLESRL